MRVLQACAEIYPLLKTGGLADVAGALPKALATLGDDVRALLPGFPSILEGLADVVDLGPLHPPGALGRAAARLLYGRLPACEVSAYVIDAPDYYRRPGGPYADTNQQPFGDNHLRFGLLGWTAAALADGLDPLWRAELVHAHDWHAALAPVYLAERSRLQGRRVAASVYTVHNLAYQGFFGRWAFDELGLPAHYFHIIGVEFHGQLSFMKGGLQFAERLTTVSPSYAREIQGAEQGCGLEGLLRDRGLALSGILNGVDDTVWNPSADALIPYRYAADRLAGKARCKTALQAELGLTPGAETPFLCVVSRLTSQKGLNLVLEALPAWIAQGAQLALLGSGDVDLEAGFRLLADRHPDQVAVRIGYDETFAHRLIAGSDLILVPSRYEPCGLTQLYGLKYGALPVVRRVGGLADTVSDTRLETLDTDATGFVFDDFSVGALLAATERAFALHRRKPDWKRVQQRAMARDFGWHASAAQYHALYHQLLPG